jgi:hypothetical protein
MGPELHTAIVVATFCVAAIVALASLAADVARLRERWRPVALQWPAATRDRVAVAAWGLVGTAAFFGVWPWLRWTLLP